MPSPDKSFHMLLTAEQRDWIRQEAYRQDVPMAEVIRQLVEQHRMEPDEEGNQQ